MAGAHRDKSHDRATAWGLSIDIDVVAPAFAPATGTLVTD